MRAELGLPSVRGDDDKGGGMMGGFGGSMGGVGGGKGKRPISVKFEIPYFTTSGIQVRYLKIIEPKVSRVSSSSRKAETDGLVATIPITAVGAVHYAIRRYRRAVTGCAVDIMIEIPTRTRSVPNFNQDILNHLTLRLICVSLPSRKPLFTCLMSTANAIALLVIVTHFSNRMVGASMPFFIRSLMQTCSLLISRIPCTPVISECKSYNPDRVDNEEPRARGNHTSGPITLENDLPVQFTHNLRVPHSAMAPNHEPHIAIPERGAW
jgi:hypothetical protein